MATGGAEIANGRAETLNDERSRTFTYLVDLGLAANSGGMLAAKELWRLALETSQLRYPDSEIIIAGGKVQLLGVWEDGAWDTGEKLNFMGRHVSCPRDR